MVCSLLSINRFILGNFNRKLVKLVEQFGLRKWSYIAQMLPGRVGKQCRERWHNHLRPNIKVHLFLQFNVFHFEHICRFVVAGTKPILICSEVKVEYSYQVILVFSALQCLAFFLNNYWPSMKI